MYVRPKAWNQDVVYSCVQTATWTVTSRFGKGVTNHGFWENCPFKQIQAIEINGRKIENKFALKQPAGNVAGSGLHCTA
jgi:hypothetical protein